MKPRFHDGLCDAGISESIDLAANLFHKCMVRRDTKMFDNNSCMSSCITSRFRLLAL